MSNEISANVRPNYLSEAQAQVDNSDLAQFSKPPRIKVVQALTKPPVKPPFREGDIVVIPHLVKLGDADTPFTFVPIAFFPSWICLNPIQATGTLKSIREYSIDPKSEIAKKCKTFTKEKCPEAPEYYLKYSETLNFFIIVEDNEEMKDIPIHLFFSRGEYATGQNLIGKIQARKAPRYACRFRAATGQHKGKLGEWPGLDIANDPQPWVSEENYFKYEKLYNDLKSLIDSKALDLDTEDFSDTTEKSGF